MPLWDGAREVSDGDGYALRGRTAGDVRAGGTPSALVRAVAERHAGEPQIDWLLRAYFREAFRVPMLQIGREGVERIARGCGSPALDAAVIHRMVAARAGWDVLAPGDEPRACWLDSATATDKAEMLRATEAEMRPDSVPGWDQLGGEGRRFLTRALANARPPYERLRILAALADQLQQQLHAAGVAGAPRG